MPITFYLYAEDREEIKALEAALYDFVKSKADNGIAVTAAKVTGAIQSFGNNPLVKRYFNAE